MNRLRPLTLFLLLVVTMQLLQGCFLFRKKNHCSTCPHFGRADEKPKEVISYKYKIGNRL